MSRFRINIQFFLVCIGKNNFHGTIPSLLIEKKVSEGGCLPMNPALKVGLKWLLRDTDSEPLNHLKTLSLCEFM